MTAIQFILIAIAAFIMLAGLFMVIRSFKRRNNAEAVAVNYDKNGIPIIPRHERNIVDQPDLDDTVAGETSIAPDRSYLNAVVEDEPGGRRGVYLIEGEFAHPHEQLGLVPELHVERAAGDPELIGDALERDLVEGPPLGELPSDDLERGGLQLGAPSAHGGAGADRRHAP